MPTASLADWLRANGATWKYIDLQPDCVVAAPHDGNIPSDTVIATVPKSAVLSAANVSCPGLQEDIGDPDISLKAAITYELLQGSSSRWSGYFDTFLAHREAGSGIKSQGHPDDRSICRKSKAHLPSGNSEYNCH